MQKIIRILACIALFSGCASASANPALAALQITDETPIIFSEKSILLVKEDASSTLTIQEVLNTSTDLESVGKLPVINAKSHYWIIQKVKNSTARDFQLRVDPSNWESIDCFVVATDGGISRLKPSVFTA